MRRSRSSWKPMPAVPWKKPRWSACAEASLTRAKAPERSARSTTNRTRDAAAAVRSGSCSWCAAATRKAARPRLPQHRWSRRPGPAATVARAAMATSAAACGTSPIADRRASPMPGAPLHQPSMTEPAGASRRRSGQLPIRVVELLVLIGHPLGGRVGVAPFTGHLGPLGSGRGRCPPRHGRSRSVGPRVPPSWPAYRSRPTRGGRPSGVLRSRPPHDQSPGRGQAAPGPLRRCRW